ncbi:MAG TPA: DUF1579 domain-containing protein [Gemmataceae bacterium]|jgi:hypothetical protein|nr:DUF1579 domain-containing protein [Gemmataceae bacterium]
MKMVRFCCLAVVAGLLVAPAGRGQEPVKPGPEHEMLKKLEGDYETTMKMGDVESKGTASYKMILGGMWLSSTFEGEIAGQKFSGHGLDTYDPAKKKHVMIWVDSMAPTPLIMEGTYDAGTKKLTANGEMAGPDGKMMKVTAVTEYKDADTMIFGMYPAGAKDPMFTVTYKRKK